MKGLSNNIEAALRTVIDGLRQEPDTENQDDDKMAAIMDSRLSALNNSKKLLNRWMNCPSAPTKAKIVSYTKELVELGRDSYDDLVKALAKKIDYDGIEKTRHKSAMEAKNFILNSIFEIENIVTELEIQLKSKAFDFSEKEFRVGFPERFARGDFYKESDYYPEWYNKSEDAVNICPFSTRGEIIELGGLKIEVPTKASMKTSTLFIDLPDSKQYWRRQYCPDITPENEDQHTKHILREYKRRREGVFFKNKGKTVYLTGNHYFALQWCQMLDNGGYMDFRESQLKLFYHLEACIRDPRCLGQLFVKSRRTGFTYIILAILLNSSTSTKNAAYGMTSKTEKDVKEAFTKLSYMFQNLPFWLRPVVKGAEDSLTSLDFSKPSNSSKEVKKSRSSNVQDYLNSRLDWRTTTNGSYDSVKLNMYLGDEFGKWAPPADYVKHLGQITPTMMPSGRVVGKAFIGSTIGPLAKGGEKAKELYYNSDVVSKRIELTGKTPTALYSYFMPAQDNMEEFTDIYGKCWTKAPDHKVKNVLGRIIKKGSNEYLNATESGKMAQSEDAFSEQKRTYPRIVEDCFRNTEEFSVFNRYKIMQQQTYNNLQWAANLYTVGNFDWKNGVKDGDVVFNPNPQGRFKVAWMPSVVDGTEYMQNRVKDVNGKFYPLNEDLGVIGCDPFSLASTHGIGSKGAIHGLTYEYQTNGAPKNMFFFEYLERPSDTEFFEDVIKVCRFYGVYLLAESNRPDLLRHLRNRGYRGFSMDRLDVPKSKLNENEKKYGGQLMASQGILDSHMNGLGAWIDNHIGESTKSEIRPIGDMGVFPFNDTLNDWLGFDPNKRTKYDATISTGLCLMAVNKDRYRNVKSQVKTRNITNFVKVYKNQYATHQ